MSGSKVLLVLLVSVAVCHCIPPYHHLMHEEEQGQDEPPMYMFQYMVEDTKTGDIKSHSEERNGDSTKGEYRLVEPDGSTRIVRYTVEGKDGGFNAEVLKEGENSQDQHATHTYRFNTKPEEMSSHFGSHQYKYASNDEKKESLMHSLSHYHMQQEAPQQMVNNHDAYLHNHAYVEKHALPLYTVPVYLKAIKTIKVPIAKFPLLHEASIPSHSHYLHDIHSPKEMSYESSDAATSSASLSLHGAKFETNIKHVVPQQH